MQNEFYWYQYVGFVMAVDAVSHHDAAAYVKIWWPQAKYKGKFPANSFPKTACGCTTTKRQEEISINLRRNYELHPRTTQ